MKAFSIAPSSFFLTFFKIPQTSSTFPSFSTTISFDTTRTLNGNIDFEDSGRSCGPHILPSPASTCSFVQFSLLWITLLFAYSVLSGLIILMLTSAHFCLLFLTLASPCLLHCILLLPISPHLDTVSFLTKKKKKKYRISVQHRQVIKVGSYCRSNILPTSCMNE